MVDKLRKYKTQSEKIEDDAVIARDGSLKDSEFYEINRSALISHPHGRKMYVSIGDMTNYRGYGGFTTHRVKSCNGCSGGLLIVKFGSWAIYSNLINFRTHCGVSDDEGYSIYQLNFDLHRLQKCGYVRYPDLRRHKK